MTATKKSTPKASARKSVKDLPAKTHAAKAEHVKGGQNTNTAWTAPSTSARKR